jgi:hypothetical protein
MKRNVSVVFAAVAAIAMSASAAQAQGITFGVGAGATIPTGKFKDAVKTGWHGLANIGYNLPSGLGVRGDFMYAQNSFKSSVASGKTKLAGGLGNVSYTFPSASTIHPYVLGSVGFFNAKSDVPGSSSETKIAFGGGAGVKFKAGTDASIFVEGRFISVSTSGNKTNFIPVTAGVSFGL